MIKLLKLARIVLLSIVLVIFAEYAATAYLRQRDDWRGALSTSPASYRKAVAFQSDYAAERQAEGWHLDDRGFWLNNDQRGVYVNITHGIRRTIGSPENGTRKVYVVGDSVTEGLVADKDTVASYLQTLLPNEDVINEGVGGQLITGDYRLIQSLDLRHGDLVILIAASADAEMLLTNHQCHLGDNMLQVVLCPLITHVDDNEVAHMAEVYVATVTQIRAYIESRDCQFFNVLSPDITASPLTDQGWAITGNKLGLAWYAAGRKNIRARADPATVDLSTLLADSEYFIDILHPDEAGNKLIAQAIYQKIVF